MKDPEQLAKLQIEGDGYSASAIERVLDADDTQQVFLRSPIPAHLTYMTTWVDKDGKLQRRPDIYNHDSALTTALQTGNTLLATKGMSSMPENTIATNEYGP